MVGVPFSADDFDWYRVPDHLKSHLPGRRRAAPQGRRGQGPGGAAVSSCKPKARQAISQAAAATAERAGGESLERTGLTDWTIGTLRRVFETRRAGQPVKAYPALVDDGDTVSVRLFDTEAEQQQAMWRGTRRLILLQHPGQPGEVRLGQADQPAEARPVAQSARLDPGPVRRLRDGRGRPADRRLRRPGLGRGVVPEAVRQGARGARRHDRPYGRPGAAGAGRLAGLRTPPEGRTQQPGPARQPDGRTRAAGRPRTARLRHARPGCGGCPT